MRPLVGVVAALELGKGASGADRDVVSVEVGVNDEPAVEHQARVVASCKEGKWTGKCLNLY